MTRTAVRFACVLLLAGLGLAACGPQTREVQPAFQAPTAAPVPQGRTRIGLLLPLSGRQASLGRALAGAAHAAFIELGDDSVELVQRDTEGTAEGAARAAALIVSDGAAIVVGPLLAAEVRAAAPALGAAGIPVVALSSDRNVAGNGIFVAGLLPEDQVRAAFGFVRAAGAERVGVLAPDDASGRAFADAARLVGSELQLEVARVALYAPSGDAANAIATVARPDPARAAAASPAPAFDTLLLADAGPRLRTLAPQLPAAGLDPTQLRLLGPAQWIAEPLLGSEPALAGALFAAPDEAAWEQLSARLGAAFGGRPPRVALIAFDATAIAVSAARQARVRPVPASLLAAPEGFAGGTGRIRLLPDGRSQRQMRLYQASPTGLRNLGPAPFEPPPLVLPPVVSLSPRTPRG